MSSEGGTGRGPIAYVLSSYPVLREYFHYLEIEGLRREGRFVYVFTVADRSAAGTEYWGVDKSYVLRRSFLSPCLWIRAFGEVCRNWKAVTNLVTITIRRLGGRPASMCKALLALAKGLSWGEEARRLNLSLIHGGWGTYAGLMALAIKISKPGSTYTVALNAHDYEELFPLIPTFVEAAHAVFTHSEERRRQIKETWPRTSKKVYAIYRGVQLPQSTPHRTRREGVQRIVSIGGLEPYKGYHVLIEACRLLRDHGLWFVVRIIGGEPERERRYCRELRRLVERYGLVDYVHFLGALPHSHAMEELATADVFVLPSLSIDVLPNVVKEAAALGVPVVTTKTTGMGELIVDGLSGRIVAKGDARGLAEAIGSVLADPIKAAQMADRAREAVVQRFSIEVTSALRVAAFDEIMVQAGCGAASSGNR